MVSDCSSFTVTLTMSAITSYLSRCFSDNWICLIAYNGVYLTQSFADIDLFSISLGNSK
jgi:hypothetical protein